MSFAPGDILYNQYNFDPVVFAWNMDPKTMPGRSPYEVFGNNPVQNIDPLGDIKYDATLKTSIENGQIVKTIQADVYYGVINVSSNDFDLTKNDISGYSVSEKYGDEGKVVPQFSRKFDKSVNGKTIKYRIVTTLHFRMVNHVKDLKENENILTIVDKINPGKGETGDPVGVSNRGDNWINVEWEYLNGNTVIHEMGHNFDMFFPWNKDNPSHSDQPGHLMYPYGGNFTNNHDVLLLFKNMNINKDGFQPHRSKINYRLPEETLTENEEFDIEKAMEAGYRFRMNDEKK